MFKKTLLALAVAGVAGTASAATITASDIDVSSEGFAAQATAAQIIEIGNIDVANGGDDITDLTIDLDASLITNDVLEVTFSGATIDTANSSPVITIDIGGTDDVASVTFLDFQGTDTIRFRVSADVAAITTPAEVDDDDNLVLSGVDLVPTSSANGSAITITSKAISSSQAIGEYEVVSTGVALADFRSQFGTTVTAFDGTIDVGNSRFDFVSGTTDVLSQTLVDNVADVDSLTFATVTHTITATDLSYALVYDSTAQGGNANGTLESGELLGAGNLVQVATTAAGGADTFTATLDLTTQVLKLTQTVVGTVDLDPAVTINVPGNTAIPEQVFTASVIADDGTNSATAAAAGTAIGSWNNNGTTFHVPVLAIDNNHIQAVIANNRSSLDADVELVVYVNGEAKSQGVVGTLQGYDQIDLASKIKAAATAEGITDIIAFDLVFEGASDNIDISVQYVNKNTSSRAVIQVTEL